LDLPQRRGGRGGARRFFENRNAEALRTRSRTKGIGVEWSGVEWSGVEWSGVEWSGVEWSGVEWSGVEWSGVECWVVGAGCFGFTAKARRSQRDAEVFLKRNAEVRRARRGAEVFEGKRGGAEVAEEDAEQNEGNRVEWSAGSWW
jgi:hypothetical protein